MTIGPEEAAYIKRGAELRLPIEVILGVLRDTTRGVSDYELARRIIEALEAAGWFLDAGESAHTDGRDAP